MTNSIVILTGHHVCHNPRAFKEAETLSAAGYEVVWLGGWLKAEFAERDRKLVANKRWKFVPVMDWTGSEGEARRVKQRQRVRRWLGGKCFEWFGFESAAQLGYCSHELWEAARKMEADLYIAHSEPALWVAERLKRMGRRVGVDMEDWFSEDLLPEARKDRPITMLRALEARILSAASYASCPSQGMSAALAREYKIAPPSVIYNAFPLSDRERCDQQWKDRKDPRLCSIHWYSQTLGSGRGLEDLFAALPLLECDVEIHLRGAPVGGFQALLGSVVPAHFRQRIFIHDLVPNAELLSRISEHDIGFAGEMQRPPNRDLAVTNKLMHYLLGGLAVVASDTTGQREVALQAPSAVFLYPCGDVKKLSDQLNKLLSMPDRLTSAKTAALRAAESKFCWEKIAPLMIRNVETAFGFKNVKH